MFYSLFRKSIVIPITMILSAFMVSAALGQKPKPIIYPDDSPFLKWQSIEKTYKPDHITKKPGHYIITDWQNVIDSTWGWGRLKTQKLEIFDTVWGVIDQEFACFVNHPDYYPGLWDSLRTLYRTEIDTGNPTYGVSRGRFAAIMNYLTLALKESHTEACDRDVNLYTSLSPGVPLLVLGPFGDNGHFGAGLTPLPDSSSLVYKTVPNHPLGLEPGDIVLGYDGIPWKELYFDLIDAQLPLYSFWYEGSCQSAYTHAWLMSAGMNWHLFDTLDVIKYGTGDTLHLSVHPLIGQNMTLFCSEQMDIPGVPMPDLNQGILASYGVISGTQIGYIYVWGWYDDVVESQFYDAVSALVSNPDITGLIIDLRLNWGGEHHLANAGLNLIFNTKELGFGYGERCSPTDHLLMCPNDFAYYHYIYGSAKAYFDKPIAILTGPGTHSAGDVFAITMKPHPMTRFFGKPSESAFNVPDYVSLGYSDWRFRNAIWNEYMLDNPSNYLTHSELEIDEHIWLSPTDVAQGFDTVVESAKSWINSQQGLQPDISVDSASIDVVLDYGEIMSETLIINNNGNRTLFYSLTPEVDSGTVFISKKLPSTTGHGGYDDYGYTWIDSDQPHGPSFSWVDISGIGTPVSLGDDSYVGPIDIGFTFPFYGDEHSEFYICSNGLITFGTGSAVYNNTHIPGSGFPNNFIAPWWDDLNPAIGGEVYYHSDEERLIVSFIGVPKYGYESSVTFQAILYPDGQAKLNYVNTELEYVGFWDFYTASVGIENSDGSDGLEIYYNAPYTIDSLSILITTDWLAVNPHSSYIAPGENDTASVAFSAKHLALGIYTGDIYIESNDPVDSLTMIPVSLTVTGGCEYAVGDVNGSESYNGLDITYGVNFFKGGSDPMCPECGLCPDWHYCGDVNGSCSYNGLDITYGVNYFKGGAGPIPCADCPPVE